MGIEWNVQCFDVLDSTQSYIKSCPLVEGLVVRALQQTNGVGRHGRKWEEGVGNLYFSFAIQPKCNLRHVGHLSIITSVALYETLSSYVGGADLRLKWPNDIFLSGKKCSGILIDIVNSDSNQVLDAVIGIGVNIESAPLDIAHCLKMFCENVPDSGDIQDAFLKSFSYIYDDWQKNDIVDIHARYCQYHFSGADVISVKVGSDIVSGTFDSIDLYGNLRLIDGDDGAIKTITSGEILLNQE